MRHKFIRRQNYLACTVEPRTSLIGEQSHGHYTECMALINMPSERAHFQLPENPYI